MSQAHRRVDGGKSKVRRRGPHHIIIARGEKVRSFAIRPGSVIFTLFAAVLLVGGSLAGAAYFLLKDDLTVTADAEREALRQDYERQIADLNRQMESLVSRHLVERERLNNEVALLLDRQGELIERQQLLTGITTEALAAGIDVLPMLAPIPIANPLRTPVPADTGVGGPIDPVTTGTTEPEVEAAVTHDEALEAVRVAADWLEESQHEALETLAEAVIERTQELAEAIADLGHTGEAGVGGPFVPFDEDLFDTIQIGLAQFTELQAFARTLPLAAPLSSVEVTSRYGRRVDPFLGTTAMHTGVDLRGSSGTPVRATGPGIVIHASTNGGYGKMVEIDHGNGVTTIYAHLSSLLVEVGQAVQVGTVIGRVGSTGRSTGPHLHYEVNRDGSPTDPMPYLRTGAEIAALL